MHVMSSANEQETKQILVDCRLDLTVDGQLLIEVLLGSSTRGF